MTVRSALSYLKKNYTIAVSAIIVVVCLAAYAIRDEQIKRLEADHDDLSMRRMRILKNMKFAAELPADLEAMRSYQREVDQRLFHPEDLGGNKVYFYQRESATRVKLPTLEQVIGDSSIKNIDRKARAKAARSEYQEITYEMNVNGTYEQVLNFMRQLEGGPAFYRLEGLSIASSAKTDGSAQPVSMRLGITILGKKL